MSRNIHAIAVYAAMPSALALCLAGCGGSDNSPSGRDPVQAPAPSPTPAPTPAPTASIYPEAPFGLTSDQDFMLIGWMYSDEIVETDDGALYQTRGDPLNADDFALSWSMAEGSYLTTAGSVTDGVLYYTFPGNNPYAFSVARPNGSESDLDVTINSISQGIPTGMIVWDQQIPGGHRTLARAMFGIPAPAAAIPRSGTYSYSFGTIGRPNRLDFDFAKGEITGIVTVSYDDGWNYALPVQYEIEPTRIEAGQTGFTARFAVPNAPEGFEKYGEITGFFAGADARTIAFSLKSPANNPEWDWWIMSYLVGSLQRN